MSSTRKRTSQRRRGCWTRRVGIRDPDGPGVLLWYYQLPDEDRVTTAPAIDAQGRLLFGTARQGLFTHSIPIAGSEEAYPASTRVATAS